MEMPGKNFKWGTIEAAGFTLDYAEAGPANPKATIVSLPGSAGLEMSTSKDRLAQTYRVIEINPPGWAGKDDVNRPMPQSEVGAILAEAIGKLVKGKFYVIGTSMGGANALFVAEHLPDQVAGIIHEGSMAPCRPEDMMMPAPTKEQIEAMHQMGESGAPPNYPMPPIHPNKPWATHEVMGKQMAMRMKMMRWTQADFTAESAMKVVRDRKIPLLALVGDKDGILKLSQADAYKAELPHAQFKAITNGEHDLQNTTPDEFVAAVETFISANPA